MRGRFSNIKITFSGRLPDKDVIVDSSQKPDGFSRRTITFFISIVGAGVLGLPYTFMRTGCLTSLVTVFLVAALTYHCMIFLIHTRRKLEDSAACAFPKISSFGDLGLAVCEPIAKFVVDALIVLFQAGFCIGIPHLQNWRFFRKIGIGGLVGCGVGVWDFRCP
ncbi:amino acid transporter family protein [Striga asiatica]|uniref:Amino acid transporter family protein n=1 Tax=Striga asiatica TaxID=4170 RepID=A0A5A7P1G3_STRAF|nr:amino acid transporter family protein [Striga asiatica]